MEFIKNMIKGLGFLEMTELPEPEKYNQEKSELEISHVEGEIQNIEKRLEDRAKKYQGNRGAEDLKADILDHKERIEKQKLLILLKIEELENYHLKKGAPRLGQVDSFSVDDINLNVSNTLSKDQINCKIHALLKVHKLDIYHDKRLVESIREYLKVIRPEIEKADREQWKIISKLHKVNLDFMEANKNLSDEYKQIEKQIQALLTFTGVSYPRYGYNKLQAQDGVTIGKVADVVELIDKLLTAEDFSSRKNFA